MIKNSIGRKEISIDIIGNWRFWIGIFFGVFTTVALSFFFSLSQEAFRLVTVFQAELLVLTEYEQCTYSYFFSALSVGLGHSVAILVWLSGGSHINKEARICKRWILTHIHSLFWVIILVVSQFGIMVSLLLYGYENDVDHLRLIEDFWLLLVLIPVVVFLQNWSSVRLLYKSTKWIGYSVVISVVMIILLSRFPIVEQNKFNKFYLEWMDVWRRNKNP